MKFQLDFIMPLPLSLSAYLKLLRYVLHNYNFSGNIQVSHGALA
jgi:hypothetical protein